MSYGFYLADIESFDDLIDWLEDHIKDIVATLGADKLPTDLRDMLKEIVQDNHAAEVAQYGWSGNEQLQDTVAVNLFHEVFAAFHKKLYIKWFRENYEELEQDSAFHHVDCDAAFNELEKLYKDDCVELTNKLHIQEMKRGLHIKLFSMADSLENMLINEANIASIQAEGKLDATQVSEDLRVVMDSVYGLEEQLNKFIGKIEGLDYKTNEY